MYIINIPPGRLCSELPGCLVLDTDPGRPLAERRRSELSPLLTVLGSSRNRINLGDRPLRAVQSTNNAVQSTIKWKLNRHPDRLSTKSRKLCVGLSIPS